MYTLQRRAGAECSRRYVLPWTRLGSFMVRGSLCRRAFNPPTDGGSTREDDGAALATIGRFGLVVRVVALGDQVEQSVPLLVDDVGLAPDRVPNALTPWREWRCRAWIASFAARRQRSGPTGPLREPSMQKSAGLDRSVADRSGVPVCLGARERARLGFARRASALSDLLLSPWGRSGEIRVNQGCGRSCLVTVS